jgi:hypothetical protein
VEWFNVYALSSKPSATKKKDIKEDLKITGRVLKDQTSFFRQEEGTKCSFTMMSSTISLMVGGT